MCTRWGGGSIPLPIGLNKCENMYVKALVATFIFKNIKTKDKLGI